MDGGGGGGDGGGNDGSVRNGVRGGGCLVAAAVVFRKCVDVRLLAGNISLYPMYDSSSLYPM